MDVMVGKVDMEDTVVMVDSEVVVVNKIWADILLYFRCT